MNGTNVDYYVSGFDTAGKRVGSLICDFDPNKNAEKLAALKEKAKSLFSDAAVVDVVSAADYNKYLTGEYVRGVDGQLTAYVAPEPTAEEKTAAEKASLAAEYASNKADMLNALQVAQLAGNTNAVANIQQDYKDMTEAYKAAVEGVTAK
ncbi:hypothetical protein [Acidaminococcus sp.]|uniref:hypothetical protein n=1 Tax=Acidaminococcus sp. TaxID=1872103 RepID=UPI003D7DED04